MMLRLERRGKTKRVRRPAAAAVAAVAAAAEATAAAAAATAAAAAAAATRLGRDAFCHEREASEAGGGKHQVQEGRKRFLSPKDN